VYEAGSEDGSSHMVAMTVSFVKGEYEYRLRLFGVHRSDDFESHVIEGIGKLYTANGYVVVKVVDKVGSSTVEGKVTSVKSLWFDVYFVSRIFKNHSKLCFYFYFLYSIGIEILLNNKFSIGV
jgi:hypothetical protein